MSQKPSHSLPLSMNKTHPVFKKYKYFFIGVPVFLTSWIFYAASPFPYPQDIIGRALFRDDFVVDKCASRDYRALGIKGVHSLTSEQYCQRYFAAKSMLLKK